MKKITLTFLLHQPYRLKRYRFFDIGTDHYYYDDFTNEEVLRRVAAQSYFPALKMLHDLLKEEPRFSFALSVSGTVLDQLEVYAPEVVHLLRQMAQTNRVEFLAEPLAHSAVSLYDPEEFANQLRMHSLKIEGLFGQKPQVVCNTELLYNDEIATLLEEKGFKGIFTEPAKHIMGWKSGRYCYTTPSGNATLLLRDGFLCDTIEGNFGRYSWEQYPYTADKLFDTLSHEVPQDGVANLMFNLEVMGTIWARETGIFDFFRAFPALAAAQDLAFVTPSQAIQILPKKGALEVLFPISKFGEEKSAAMWTGNVLQQSAIDKLKEWGPRIRLSGDLRLLQDWIYLQSIDHLFYMSTLRGGAGSFSPFATPYLAFSNYMNILSDFFLRVEAEFPSTIENEELKALVETIRNQDEVIAHLQDELRLKQ